MENYYLTSILQVLLKYYVRNWSPRKLWESQVKHGELKDPLQVGGYRGFLSGFFISSSTKRTPIQGILLALLCCLVAPKGTCKQIVATRRLT